MSSVGKAILVAKIDLEKKIDAYHKDLNLPSYKDNVMISKNYRDFRKYMWYSSIKCKMERTIERNKVKFICPEKFHTLMYSYRVHSIPRISVKSDEYRICWPHNLANALVHESKISISDYEFQTFDRVGSDISFQYTTDPQIRDYLSEMMGNRPELENYSNVLEQTEVYAFTNWCYQADGSRAIPLNLCKGSQVTHTFILNNEIKNVLKMQRLIDGVWTRIPVDESVLVCEQTHFDPPDLWGRFQLQTKDELESMPEKVVMWYFDYVKCDSKNPSNGVISVNLVSSKPVKAMYWVLNNGKDNYTDSEDVYRGDYPWTSYNYDYGDIERENSITPNQCIIESLIHNKTKPSEKGFGFFTYADNPNGLDGEISVSLDNSKPQLSVKIKDDQKYYLCVRLLIYRKLTFTKVPNTEIYDLEIE